MKSLDKRLAQATLPIMQETGSTLRHLIGLKSTGNQHLQAVLLGDPAAAIAVFRELDRARPGAARQVTDAAHAVSMIGIDPFRRLFDHLPVVEHPAAADAAGRVLPGPSLAYSQSAHAACYAAALARHKGMGANQEVPTAALLQNPAVLALWATEPESALRATNAVRDGVPPQIAFGAELGGPLDAANRRLAAAWGLPRLARQAMGDWDDFSPRPFMVSLATGLAQSTAGGWGHAETETLTELVAEFLGMDADRVGAWVHRQAIDAARALQRFDYPLAGFELLLLPGGEDEEYGEDDPPLRAGRPPPAAAPRPDLHETLAGVVRRIGQQAGANRVVFAMLNRDRSRLRTRLALGGDAGDGLRRLDQPLAERNLFSALMGKPQSLWLHEGNAAKYRDYLPAALRALLAPEGAYLMSLFVGDRPLGLMIGDGTALGEPGYRRFRALCHEATAALTAGSRVAVPTTD